MVVENNICLMAIRRSTHQYFKVESQWPPVDHEVLEIGPLGILHDFCWMFPSIWPGPRIVHLKPNFHVHRPDWLMAVVVALGLHWYLRHQPLDSSYLAVSLSP